MNVFLAWSATTSALVEPLIARWTAAEDHSHADGYGDQPRRRASLAGRALLRRLLAEIGEGEGWHLHTDARGKLFAGGTAEAPAICLSHSGDMVAAAICQGAAVGVDIERHRRRDFQALAGYAFGPTEARSLERGDAEARFFRLWTLREAMAKAEGKGLAMAVDRCDRVGDGPFEGCWTVTGEAEPWHLVHFLPCAGYSLAVAVKGEHNRPVIPCCFDITRTAAQ